MNLSLEAGSLFGSQCRQLAAFYFSPLINALFDGIVLQFKHDSNV